MPRVSVIIPTYNCAKYVTEAIDSVLGQTYKDFEIIVIDDGSTDFTKQRLLPYIEKGRIKYLYQENSGHAVSRNTGIRNSSSEYIAFLDADDLWMPNRLEEGVRILDTKPDVGLVHSHIIKFNGQGEKKVSKRSPKYLSGKIANHLITRKAHVSSPTATIRRKCINKVGLIDENMARMGSEDRDFWYRIAREFNVFYIDKPLAYYRLSSKSASSNKQKMHEGRIYSINKNLNEPGDFILRQRALSSVYKESAEDYLMSGDIAAARKEFLKSFTAFPLNAGLLLIALKWSIKRSKKG
ncbi:MAG: glycosyltransferase family A protein [Candidatus Omnitrophota bacterium]